MKHIYGWFAIALLSCNFPSVQTKTWLDFFEQHQISDANWAISDKQAGPQMVLKHNLRTKQVSLWGIYNHIYIYASPIYVYISI